MTDKKNTENKTEDVKQEKATKVVVTENKEPVDDNLKCNTIETEQKPETKNDSSKTKNSFTKTVLIGTSFVVACLAFSVGYLTKSSISKSSSDNIAVTADKTDISYKDLMTGLTTNNQAKVLIQQKIVGQIFENNHSDLVSDKEVKKEVDRIKKDYGSNFDSIISQSGFTEKTFFTYTKQNLIMRAFVKDQVKFTDKEINNAYTNFVPSQTINLGVFESKADAEAYKKNPKDSKFKENVHKVELGTANNERGLSDNILKASYDTKQGQMSDVLEENDTQSPGAKVYAVVEVIKHVDKGTVKEETKDIESYLKLTKSSDTAFATETMKKELDKLNVNYNDNDLKKAMVDAFKAVSTRSN